MKNMKVAKKLIVSFLIVALLAGVVGGVGIFGMSQIDNASHRMYYSYTEALPEIAKALEYSQRLRVQLRNVILFSGDLNALSGIEQDVRATEASFESFMTTYNREFVDDEQSQRLFNDAMRAYENEFKPGMGQILAGAKADAEQADLKVILNSLTASSNLIVENLTECMDIKLSRASSVNYANTQLFRTLLIVSIAVIAVAIGIALFLAFYISGLISKPLTVLTTFMQKAGTTGDIFMSDADRAVFSKNAQIKDEIGQTIGATSSFIAHVTEVSGSLQTIAGGDLTVEVKLLSDSDTMGLSLKSMVSNLNNMFSEINSATSQVSAGSKQIADGATALAAGSTEQASSVEELAASLTEVSTSTNENADMAKEASGLSGEIKGSAEKGSVQMDQMMQAVTEINDASSSISKVIKVIDDIAFQTNILALNAAVEAARAGQHGKGFAVVAEEVRNLAGKSAEAAKDTSALIENSIEKANFGMSIATETSASLQEIVSGINRNAEIITKIEQSSEDQARAIKQINVGIDQVAQVVQQNSATAEESAAASEEMSGQAHMLEGLIAQFKLKDSGAAGAYAKAAAASKPMPMHDYVPEEPAYTPPAPAPARPAPSVHTNSDSFGYSDKY